MMQSPAKQMKALASAIAGAFSRADLTPEETSQSILRFDDLPWACPPLLCDLTIDDVPLQYYLDVPMGIASEALLYNFWKATLGELYTRQRHVIQHGTFYHLRRVTPRGLIGQRALRFSVPSGYPSEMSDMVGIEFSLEAAHAALISCPIQKHVADENNYYVITSEGYTIGVEKGLPATSSPWDIPATGMIDEMTRVARGHTDHTCLYDQIARCRSLLHEYPSRFKEQEALDWGLQALRRLSLGGYCPSLITASQTAPIDTMVLRAKAEALAQAMEVMQAKNIHDRAKVRTLEQLLVPLVLSPSTFCQKIYNTKGPIPFSITDKAILRINTWLKTYYDEHIPSNVKG